MKQNKGWAWFCHHKVLLEYCTDFAGRVKYIKIFKPNNEIPARLYAFRLVKGKLPKKLVKAYAIWNKAWVAYEKAGAAYEKAGAAYEKAGAAYDKVYAACYPQVLALFHKECPDVKWDEKNQTLVF